MAIDDDWWAEQKRKANPPPLPLEWFAEIAPELHGQWLIKRLVPSNGTVLIYGHPGCGKSFIALDMAMHLALSREWFGRRVNGGGVVYLAAEGQGGLRLRVEAFRRHHGITDDIPFALIPCQVDLLDPKADIQRLIGTVRFAAERWGGAVAMVVLDTLSRTFGGGDENTSDMAAYIANVGQLQAAVPSTVLFVHHRPKNSENETPRGHGSLLGACDTVMLVEAGDTKRLKVTKQKDGQTGDELMFRLTPIVLGEDEDGEEVTSCIVSEAGATDLLGNGSSRPRLTPTQMVVLEQLRLALSNHGRHPPLTIPDEQIDRVRVVKVVDVRTWKDMAISALRTGTDATPDSLRRKFDRTRETLQALKIVRVWEGDAWM